MGPGTTMVDRRGATGFWCGNLREREHLENLDTDGTIILQWILKKWDRGHGPVCFRSRQRYAGGCCRCRNEASGSIKFGEILYWLRTC